MNVTVDTPPVPSPAGASTTGSAARFVSESAGAGVVGGGAGLPLPIVPLTGRAPGTTIVQLKRPRPAVAELHVQSTSRPCPIPEATVLPCPSVIVTVHGRPEDARARKRTGPPSTPSTVGE